MIRTIRAHAIRLSRPRLVLASAVATVLYTVVATGLAVGTAEPASSTPAGGLPLESLAGAGGGTAATTWVAGFAAVFVLASVTAYVAGDFSRGTFRAAVLQQPNRVTLLGGMYVAVLTMAGVLLALAMATGWTTSRLVAPGQGIPVAGWASLESIGLATLDWLRVLTAFAGWALLGTAIAVVVRSVPVALAIAVVWAGPVENVIGDAWTPGRQWFPGLLLRTLMGANPDVGDGRAALVLVLYGLAALGIVWLGVTRRDVTA